MLKRVLRQEVGLIVICGVLDAPWRGRFLCVIDHG